jgi:hypothetical protein
MLAPTTTLQSMETSTRYVRLCPLFCLQGSDCLVAAPLPRPKPVYKLMPSSSPNFVGCEDYLQKLDEYFCVRAANEMGRRVFVLFGVGGVGKTQICLKFVEKSPNR